MPSGNTGFCGAGKVAFLKFEIIPGAELLIWKLVNLDRFILRPPSLA
jgi:hypothetical protein